ncbi:stage VI sporulation protein F [Paenibacillus hodogayensis]|uniref:Stage VI sporulation protein F n=1 Tax=Paenibacillus hodogayensis TaxID=279208 RepID=A0ABV5W4Q7_9BACL
MSGKEISKDVLNAVKKKVGKNVSEKDIYKLASGVKPSTVQSEKQLRQLIKQVSSMVKVPVSDATMNEIVSAVQKSGMNPNNMEALMKMMMKK